MKSFALILSMSVGFANLMSPSQAATRAQIYFTPESSIEWVKIMSPEISPSKAMCVTDVNRPDYGKDGEAAEGNKILCLVDGQKVTYTLGDDLIEAWGTHFDKDHFTFTGKVADQVFAKFKPKARNLSEYESEHSIWSRLVMCDSVGSVCFVTYLLSEQPDGAGKVFCTQETEQIAQGEPVLSSASVADPALYYQDRIDAQLKQGIRKQVKVFCAIQK